MFDEKLLGYVILKCVSIISGKRGKGSIVRILRGSNDRQVGEAVEKFELEDLYGILKHIADSKITELIERLSNKKFIYTEHVKIGNYNYPMIFMSEEGCGILTALEKSEEPKMGELRRQAEELGKAVFGLGEEAIRLDLFLKCIFNTAAGLNDTGNTDAEIMTLCDTFMGSLTNYHASTDCGANTAYTSTGILYRGFRSFLGAVPEKQAAVFRVRYGIEDEFFHPLDVVKTYYSMPEEDIDACHKTILGKFFYKSWKRKYWVVGEIAKLLFGDRDTDRDIDEDDDYGDNRPVVDTYEQTYRMYMDGKDIGEIARARGLTKNTIMGHFVKLVPKYDIAPLKLVDRERASKILKAAEKFGKNSLKLLKDNLPEDFDYGEIKLVVELDGYFNVQDT